jgi:hypothetical protein
MHTEADNIKPIHIRRWSAARKKLEKVRLDLRGQPMTGEAVHDLEHVIDLLDRLIEDR